MKTFCKILFALFSLLSCVSGSYADNNETTFLGPILRGSYTSTINDFTAYSVAGEVGAKNYRVGGTLAWKLMENQRFKLSAEYLWQKINYSFFLGDSNEWVDQVAVGATYQYDLCGMPFTPSLYLSGYLSHAPSKNVGTETRTFLIPGAPITLTDQRRIAGSNAGGVSPGIIVVPWCGSQASIELNYDNVDYDTRYASNEDPKGFGGTFRFNQQITAEASVGASAAIRQPFNNYQAHIDYLVPFYGTWSIGLDGAYTAGKHRLPSTWDVGLSANYYLDGRCASCGTRGDFKGEATRPPCDDFLHWTSDPAVYMPQVLAIAEDRITGGCPFGIPTFVGTIPDGSTAGGGVTVVIDTSTFFTGSNLTFTLSPSAAPAAGNSYSLDPVSGVFTASGPSTQVITFTVTATNPCGSATSNVFTVTY